MPPKKKPKFAYPHEQLILALEAVRKGETVNAASKRFGIPQSTLAYKVSGKTPIDRKMGPQPLLGIEAETMLANWVKGLATCGFPICKADLLSSVKQIVKDLKIEEKFPKGGPGEKWVNLFLKRHPEIVERKAEKLSSVRATVTEKFIRNWFIEVKQYILENNLNPDEILSDPERVFNMDETAFFICPNSGKVLGVKGQKNLYQVHTGSEKENITVLCNVNASGKHAPTLIIYPGQRLPPSERLKVPDDWAVAKSDNGWITGQVFFEYFANVFFEWLKNQNPKFPIIIFIDGHTSHLTYHLSLFCSENNIILIALPPNCTHVIQPLDVAVFGAVKKVWAASVHTWRTTNEEKLTKYNFAILLKQVLDKTMKPETIINGFRRCGLCPFNPDAVDFTKVDVLNSTTCALQNSLPDTESTSHTISESCHTKENCLQFFETFINPCLLQEFVQTYNTFTPVWKGEDSAHDLYVAWKKAKDFVSKNNIATTTVVAIDVICTPTKTPSAPTTNNEESTFLDATPGPSRALNAPSSASTQEKLAKVLSPGSNGSDVPSPFKKNLFWPGTPEKTKRIKRKVKLPAVVTSKEWQEYEKTRKEKKKQEDLKKAERKKVREEKKEITKQKPEKKASKKKLVYDEEEDWQCKVCLKRYSAELIIKLRRRWIECDKCKNTFHYKCIPKKHLDAFGIEESDDDDDELVFYCHFCAADIDSDADPFVLSETEPDDL